MSYEGYVQYLCRNGHYFHLGYDYGEGPEPTCPHCKAPVAMENSVDTTNCDDYGIITPEVLESLVVTKAKVEVCPTCKHEKQIEPEVHRIPTEEERKKLRSYWDALEEKYVRLNG